MFVQCVYRCESFEGRLRQSMSKHNTVVDDSDREVMRTELMGTLKILTIPPKCIATKLEESVANPDLDIETESPSCGNCFVCKKKVMVSSFIRTE